MTYQLSGKRFQELLDERNLSLADLSRISGIAKTTLYDVKDETRIPRKQTLDKIADALDISVEELTDSPAVKSRIKDNDILKSWKEGRKRRNWII